MSGAVYYRKIGYVPMQYNWRYLPPSCSDQHFWPITEAIGLGEDAMFLSDAYRGPSTPPHAAHLRLSHLGPPIASLCACFRSLSGDNDLVVVGSGRQRVDCLVSATHLNMSRRL